LTRVEYLKSNRVKHFAIVDAAMNDLLRPALYQAWQEIILVVPGGDAPVHTYDIVGSVCETGDFLGKERELGLTPGDLLAVRSAGAYGFSMSSNYNSRPRPVELMISGDRVTEIRPRETLADLFHNERLPD
jgi:diaminopimelate decarboxylase